MNHELQITEVTSIDHTLLDELSTLLINVVHGGAAIGFLPPVSQEEAREYWEHVLDPSVILLVARLNGQLCGTIQLHLAQKTNGTHRAEVAKLMVHPDQRRNGIARALLNTVDSRAKLEGRSLLVLYTREGDPSNLLYQSHEYIEAGRIPHFARSADGSLHTNVFYYKLLG